MTYAVVTSEMFTPRQTHPTAATVIVTPREASSRARAKVQRDGVQPDVDLPTQRTVVEAFLAAARRGDFTALLETLSAEAVIRADPGATDLPRVVRGREQVARYAHAFGRAAPHVRVGTVNGTAGLIARDANGDPFAVLAITVRDQVIVEIDILADRERLRILPGLCR